MSLLSEYKLNLEHLENEKIWRTKTGQRKFKADSGANFRSVAGSLVSRLFANRKRSTRRSD